VIVAQLLLERFSAGRRRRTVIVAGVAVLTLVLACLPADARPAAPAQQAPDASEPTSSPHPLHSAAAVEAAAETTVRAFGRQPYQDVVAAAAAEASARRSAGCSLSDARLAGMMLAVPFTEAGPLASSTVAPSPMTLSRWDGSAALYSFGNTATQYRTAFWHPGIGLWQFDHPWDNTAAERIDTAASAQLAAQVMAGRFCGWTASTGLTQFAYTVRPWHGCDATTGPGEACLTIFLNHFRANGAGLDDDSLEGFTLQDGVTRLGGARWRSCQIVGQAAPVLCLYVDPDAAEGSKAWTAPGFSTNPISSPFYVVRDGAAERRYWLGDDSGYAIDITASTTIGTDPRTTIAWASGDRLCDLSTLRGACELRAPSWKRWRYDQVAGTYTPLVGDFDGNGRSDLFWYAPGSGADGLWLTRRDGGPPVKLSPTVNGTYEPFVGDFDGNGRDDIFWYAPGAAADGLWLAAGGGSFSASGQTVGGDYEPLVGDFDGNGRSDIFWYAPTDDGSSPEQLWLSSASGGFAVSARPVGNGFEPFVGDFNGDALDDIFWYGPGGAADGLWFGRPGGAFLSSSRSVGGTFQPLVGDFDGNGLDDIFWYGTGFAADSLWVAGPGGTFQSRSLTVNGNYQPVVGDISGNRRDDIVWYAPGAAGDAVWLGGSGGNFTSDSDVMLRNQYVPLVGDFDGAAGHDIFWYAAGSVSDGLWFD
jgi:FG-GAP-like repeat